MTRAQSALAVATLALGLALDVHTDLPSQIALSVAVWGVLGYVLWGADRELRLTLVACLAIATLGEMFLSLVWGLYAYRLGNIPFFVPPGHALLLLLGLSVSRHLSERAALGILAAAAAYALFMSLAGHDTLAVALFALLAAAALALPKQRRLYASTFVLALALELYGTWLGNWTWVREVPALGLVTTNPPAEAGAFYAALDALTACVALLVVKNEKRQFV